MLRRLLTTALMSGLLAACGSDPAAGDEGDDAPDVESDTTLEPDAEADTESDATVEPDAEPDAPSDATAEPDAADAVQGDGSSDANVDAGADVPDGAAPDSGAADVFSDALDPDAALPDVTDSGADVTDTGADVVDPGAEACVERQVGAPTWPEAPAGGALAGAFAFAQTHVVDADEARQAPRVIADRSALVLFTPTAALPDDASVWIRVVDAGPDSVLAMQSPEALPAPLEQALTTVPLDPWSTTAWSVMVPADWMREGATLEVGWLDAGALRTASHTLENLAAPHRFTITRTRVVLFGEEAFPALTESAERIARDFYASVPFATLRWVDSEPWRLDEVVIRTADGPLLVSSEAERIANTSDEDHWAILKHQVALRLSLANTGRGLRMTGESDGDSSPYSFGTSVGMGWFRNPDGSYEDLDDAPWAAGWTGWTAMWLGECGNAFIHEVGHSFTLAHFTEGTASSWGIADEYPQNGVQLATHPWGFDTERERFRTWYRVDRSGPVSDAGGLVGKRDPMNGGEEPNAQTCFPSYTAYHAQRIQDWATSNPTIAAYDGRAGIFRWNATAHAWERTAPAVGDAEPVAVDVPVATLVGTLGRGTVSQTYPPIWIPSGNVFALPDPFGAGLPAAYTGARWFLQIEYLDGSLDHALIARGLVPATTLALYSVNVAADRAPVAVRLYQSAQPYPGIVADDAVLVHERILDPVPATWEPVVTLGDGRPGAASVRVTRRCEPGFDCDRHETTLTWRGTGPLQFTLDGVAPTAQFCSDDSVGTGWELPVVNEAGDVRTAVLTAWRQVEDGGFRVRVPLDDATPWSRSAAARESLVVRATMADNADWPAGRWRLATPASVTVWGPDGRLDTLPLVLDIQSRTLLDAPLSPEWRSPTVTTANSSTYFLVEDPAMGPTSRVWWDDGIAGPTVLTVPVGNGVRYDTLYVNAERLQCTSSRSDLNAGRGAVDCDHRAILWVDAAQNPHLEAGRWQSPASAPLVLEARRWHDPDGTRLLNTFALRVMWER